MADATLDRLAQARIDQLLREVADGRLQYELLARQRGEEVEELVRQCRRHEQVEGDLRAQLSEAVHLRQVDRVLNDEALANLQLKLAEVVDREAQAQQKLQAQTEALAVAEAEVRRLHTALLHKDQEVFALCRDLVDQKAGAVVTVGEVAELRAETYRCREDVRVKDEELARYRALVHDAHQAHGDSLAVSRAQERELQETAALSETLRLHQAKVEAAREDDLHLQVQKAKVDLASLQKRLNVPPAAVATGDSAAVAETAPHHPKRPATPPGRRATATRTGSDPSVSPPALQHAKSLRVPRRPSVGQSPRQPRSAQQQLVDVLRLLGHEGPLAGKSLSELTARLEVLVTRLQESCTLLKAFVLEVANTTLPGHAHKRNAFVPSRAAKAWDTEGERRHLDDLLQLLREALPAQPPAGPGRGQLEGFVLATRGTLVAELLALQDVLGLGEPLTRSPTSEGLEDLQLIVCEAYSGLQQLLLTLTLPEEREASFSALDSPRLPLPPPTVRPSGHRM